MAAKYMKCSHQRLEIEDRLASNVHECVSLQKKQTIRCVYLSRSANYCS